MHYYLPNKKDCFPNGWNKINTYLFLAKCDLPVLKSVLITDIEDLNNLDSIKNFLDSEICTLRFQYISPSKNPIRGGNAFLIDKETLLPFHDKNRHLWLMEPTNRFTNKYGINIMYRPDSGRILFEIIGSGFDISDINRGDIYPHHVLEFNIPTDRGYYSNLWYKANVKIVSEEEYVGSIILRKKKLEKMGLSVSNVTFPEKYTPISLSKLELIDSYVNIVFEKYGYKRECSITTTILENDRIVFWDIQTPSDKIMMYTNC